MNKFTDLFKQIENTLVNEQRRVHVDSTLKVYYGITIEKLFRISFISSIRPLELESTKEIKVTQGKESDNVYWTCFDLLNDDAKDVFFVFCDSLVDSVSNSKDDFEALNSLRERYYAWKLLLRNKGKMAYEIYQGLYGELYFLKEELSKQVGVEKAVLSWVGPEGYSKDYSIGDTWFEIKTIGTSSNSVKINSLAQLESDVKGHLVIITVEKMSDQFEGALSSVSLLYRSILDGINSHEIRENFVNKVLKYGYVDDDATVNNQKFEVKKINYYSVDKKFPKLTRDTIKISAISQVTYDLIISAIEEYMEEMKWLLRNIESFI